MRPVGKKQSALRAPLNDMFGTEAAVRILRVLAGTREPMSQSRLAGEAKLALSGIARTISTLEDRGIVEYVGVGARRPVRFRSAHPLADAIRALYCAERSRFDSIVDALKEIVPRIAPLPRSVWLQGSVVRGEDRLGDPLVVGLLTSARELDLAIASCQDLLEDLEREQDVSIEVQGRTAADVLAGTAAERAMLRDAMPLLGAPPLALIDAARPPHQAAARTRGFTHAELDARARALATAIAERIRHDPGLVEQARAQLDARMTSASPGEQRELREWKRILRTMSLPRLRKFLVEESERANRLRQSIPFLSVLSPEEREQLIVDHGNPGTPQDGP